MPDHRHGRKFLLFTGETLLGHSDLEWEDAGDGEWLRSGLFTPADAYLQFQGLFQRYTRQLGAARAQHHYDRAEFQTLTERIQSLNLRLLHPGGSEIAVAAFELQDCADALAEEPRELQVEIRDRMVYDRVFSQLAP